MQERTEELLLLFPLDTMRYTKAITPELYLTSQTSVCFETKGSCGNAEVFTPRCGEPSPPPQTLWSNNRNRYRPAGGGWYNPPTADQNPDWQDIDDNALHSLVLLSEKKTDTSPTRTVLDVVYQRALDQIIFSGCFHFSAMRLRNLQSGGFVRPQTNIETGSIPSYHLEMLAKRLSRTGSLWENQTMRTTMENRRMGAGGQYSAKLS